MWRARKDMSLGSKFLAIEAIQVHLPPTEQFIWDEAMEATPPSPAWSEESEVIGETDSSNSDSESRLEGMIV